jgi:hypothetical protein
MTSSILRRFCCAIAVALTLLLPPSLAHAEPSSSAVEIGIEPSLDVQLAPLASPSPAHPWGTLALAWHEVDTVLVHHLKIGEWDLREGRFVKVLTLRDTARVTAGLRLARSGETLLLLESGLAGAGDATELIQVGLDLVEQGSVSFADGSLASLAVDARFVAVGTYEAGGYELRLLDAATLAILTTRSFRGPLTPWPVTDLSSHALRFESGRLYLALAESDPRFVRLALPSLATELSTVFVVPLAHRWAYTSARLSSAPSPLSFDSGNDRFLLSSDLKIGGAVRAGATPQEDEASAEMPGERLSQRIFGRTVSTSVRRKRWMLRVTQKG